MKAVNFSTILGRSKSLRSVRLALAAPALVMTFSVAQAGTPAPVSAPAEPTAAANWIGFTVGGAFVSGNDAGMMRRTQTNGDFYGGIDTFQYSQALDKSTTLTLDGHALPGLEDYEANLNITRADIGYIKAGYKQFRTWYDGTGGYLADPGQQFGTPLLGDELSVDRGELFFEAGLRMEHLPEITFSYKHAYRDGEKDSLTWGEGQASNLSNEFKLTPALWLIDESSDTFELDIEHTLGNTDLGMGLVYEHASVSNTRVNEKGYATTVTTPATTNANAYRAAVQNDDYTLDLFAGNIHSVTRFNDKLWLSGGFAYNSVNTDTEGGYRSFNGYPGNNGSYPYSVFRGTRGGDAFYRNMQGGAEVSQVIGNLNLMWAPIEDLTITPSLRFEHENQSSWNSINSYTVVAPGTSTYPAYGADSDLNETISALDIRYKGVTDWVFYAKGQWGNENETVNRANVSPGDPLTRDWLKSDINIDEQEYTLGANWYPIRCLSFAVQGFHADRDQSLDHTGYNNPLGTQGAQTLRPIMVEHETETDDLNLRMTWRPLGNVSLVTRYDYASTEYNNMGVHWSPGSVAAGPPASLIWPEVQSGLITSNILSESITWSPMERLYLQASGSWVWSQTDVDQVGTSNEDNDYLTASLSAGYAIDDKTDLTGSFTYYGASNYAAMTAPTTATAASMGYGLNTEEYGVSLTLTRVLTANMVWNLRYAFMTSQTTGSLQDQSGGFNDFTAQMVSTGLQVRF